MTIKANTTPAEAQVAKLKRVSRSDANTLGSFVEGWAFYIPLPAFRSAMDITREERRERGQLDAQGKPVIRLVWSQGNPPAFGFRVGDMFQAPAFMGDRGPERPIDPDRSIQVQAVEGDRLEIEIISQPNGERRRAVVSQAELADTLKSGNLSKLKMFSADGCHPFLASRLHEGEDRNLLTF